MENPDRYLTSDQLSEKYNPDLDEGQHPEYTVWDWIQVVAQRSTRMGYWDWVADRIEKESR